MKTFSPSEAAFEGFRVIRSAPGVVLAWAGVYVVVSLLMTAVMVAIFGPQMASVTQISQDSGQDPQRIMALVGSMAGLAVIAIPLGILIQAVMYGAVFRFILRPADSDFAYLRLGGDELRLIGLWIVQFFVFLGAYIGAWIAAILLVLLGGLIGRAVHMHWIGGAIAIIAVLGVICAFIWVSVRLSLATPMTIATRKISVFGSWRVTRGRFWSLLGCYLLTFIFGILIAILGGLVALCVGAVISRDWTTMGILTHNPREAMMHAGVYSMAKLLTVATLAQTLVSGLLTTVSRTVFLAPFAEAYRELTDDGVSDGPWENA